VKIDCDPKKNQRNIRERGLSFDRADEFDFTTASFFLDKRLHVLVYQRRGAGIWVISYRKANDREARKYGKAKTID
jgi:uncharacterized DUF497 family protein